MRGRDLVLIKSIVCRSRPIIQSICASPSSLRRQVQPHWLCSLYYFICNPLRHLWDQCSSFIGVLWPFRTMFNQRVTFVCHLFSRCDQKSFRVSSSSAQNCLYGSSHTSDWWPHWAIHSRAGVLLLNAPTPSRSPVWNAHQTGQALPLWFVSTSSLNQHPPFGFCMGTCSLLAFCTSCLLVNLLHIAHNCAFSVCPFVCPSVRLSAMIVHFRVKIIIRKMFI